MPEFIVETVTQVTKTRTIKITIVELQNMILEKRGIQKTPGVNVKIHLPEYSEADDEVHVVISESKTEVSND